MSKEQRLSQLLAQRDTVKSTTNPQFTEIQKAVKAPNLFQGQAKTYEKNLLMRGRHFPKDIARNKQVLEMQRQQEVAKEQE